MTLLARRLVLLLLLPLDNIGKVDHGGSMVPKNLGLLLTMTLYMVPYQ